MAESRRIALIALAGALGGYALSLLQQRMFGKSSPSPQPARSARLGAVYAFLASYRQLSPAALCEHLAPSFTHQVLPSSLDMPSRDKTAFAGHAAGITSIFQTFEMVPLVAYDDPSTNAVVVHAKMIGELKDIGPWENECMMTLRMSADGLKVVEMKEFVDSARAKMLKEKLMSKMSAEKADSMMND